MLELTAARGELEQGKAASATPDQLQVQHLKQRFAICGLQQQI